MLLVAGGVLAAAAFANSSSTSADVAESPSQKPTSASPEAEPSASASPVTEPADWTIGYGEIGPLTVGMTADDVAREVGVTDTAPWFENQFSAECAVYLLGGTGQAAEVTAIAFTGDGNGPVDLFVVHSSSEPSSPLITAEGIGLGSPEQSVRDAYGDSIVESAGIAGGESLNLLVVDGANALRFVTDGGVVTEIRSGATDAVQSFSECA